MLTKSAKPANRKPDTKSLRVTLLVATRKNWRVNGEQVRELAHPLNARDEVVIVQALSGG